MHCISRYRVAVAAIAVLFGTLFGAEIDEAARRQYVELAGVSCRASMKAGMYCRVKEIAWRSVPYIPRDSIDRGQRTTFGPNTKMAADCVDCERNRMPEKWIASFVLSVR